MTKLPVTEQILRFYATHTDTHTHTEATDGAESCIVAEA